MLERLAANSVEFVIVGGVAATVHGSPTATYDLDICYSRATPNLKRLIAALAPLHPRLRGAPENLPFFWDLRTLRNGSNFTLSTDMGDIDLLGELSGIGGYENARARSVTIRLDANEYSVLSVAALIASKRAAGRPKDLSALPELEALGEASHENE